MAMLTKDELLSKIEGTGLSDEEKISFMEDISDSFDPTKTEDYLNVKSELETMKTNYEDLQNKYKERFLNADSVSKKEFKEENKELQEKVYIDVKDIFTK